VSTTCTEDGHKDYQNKQYNINQKDEGTLDDRGRCGGGQFNFEDQGTRNMPNPSGI